MRIARPSSSTVTSMEQVSGQSWGQTARMPSIHREFSAMSHPFAGGGDAKSAHRMNRKLSLVLLIALTPLARAANWPDRPALHAVRAMSPIAVDGDLSDAAWQSATEFTEFTPDDPADGEPATTKTTPRIGYVDTPIYSDITMYNPGHPPALLERTHTFG